MIYVCKNNKLNIFLENYILDFLKNDDNKIIGIDFEFNRIENKRQIALCQINFNDDDIFLFYPPDIKKDIFKKLLTSNIIKVIHGGESLDIPYLFDNIININNTDELNAFFNNLYDTRYMCEYYNVSNNIDGKCKIYDLLLQMKVITKKTFDNLMKNDKLMGNIWEINIDVKNMSKELTNYSVYDVLYLPALFKSFPKTKDYKIIQTISCIVYKMRYNGELDEAFINISKYNLDKYSLNKSHIYYNDIYLAVYYWLLTDDFFYNLYSINYFKKYLELVIKNILYNLLNNKIKNTNYKYDYINHIEMKIKEQL